MQTLADNTNEYNCFYQANAALRLGYYKLSIQLYVQAFHKYPFIEDMVRFNLKQALLQQDGNVSTDKLEQLLAKKQNKSSLLNSYKDNVLLTENDFVAKELEQKNNIFIAKNNDPYFTLNKSIEGFHPGFYGLSFYIFANTNLVGQLGKIYIDYGEGYSEEHTVRIPLNTGLNERVVFLQMPPVSLRFDPLEAQTEFSLFDFEITTINEHTIADYFKKVLLQARQMLSDVDQPLLKLYQQYDQFITESNEQIGSYEQWIATNEVDEALFYEEIQALENHFTASTLFSIVMPTYNTEEKYLRECIDSILNQRFSNFEICIADDCSPDTRVREVLQSYESQDERIKIVYREKNGHISKATNSAIEIATGRFIVLVDHDDKLSPHALYHCAKAIFENPNTKIIYSDEDKIDKNGVRSNPHFKSDWNLDLLFSQNYVSHLGVYDSKLINAIGGFRVGVEGSQDYDLLLRCLPHVDASRIIHIPKVLYHWRAIEGSTASDAGEKTYTTDAGIKALQDYFDTNGPEGVKVDIGKVPNTYKVDWPIPDPSPKVSMLIPTRDGKDITEQAVRSILEKTIYTNYDILIIDNGSEKQETFDFFEQIQAEDDRISVIRYDQPFNYSAINNFGVKHTDGEIIALVNNDVEVINPEWLTEMVMHAIRPEIGCVGAKLYYANGQIQHAGVITSLGGVAGHSHKYFPKESVGYFHRLVLVQDLTAVTAACLLVKRSIYNEVGGLNENDLTVAFNDVDFCLRVYSAGYRNLWTPYAELYHHESISRGAEDNPEKVARFNKEMNYMKSTWPSLLNRDPHYSPNLTKAREDFSIDI
ncbi:glycosyltransferase family 2 protein [Psychrobacter immobilis]|uniref:glycosyltransferase family 2 protein n=1 Tax=Psychrobacter immobilis TaxID=498 RepID=UPI00191808A1|nr:glycosyltransferase family 2 protein [Psychrobacter immobilis]